MPTLAQNVLGYIRKHALLQAGDRVGAAVSGGADSVAMLRLLLELRREIGIVLSVVHFNHKLRGAESDGDERFVADMARSFELEFHCESGDVAGLAAGKHLSIETAAREMRYAYFRRTLEHGRVNRVATAHTLDDQAETVLMRVARGAGTRGLAGIYPQLAVAGFQFADGSIVRPLLEIRRIQLEGYLKAIGQGWREDVSNHDLRHTRNRVRHSILPLLERDLNPAVREALCGMAEIARGEEEYWETEVARALSETWNKSDKSLRINSLKGMPLALRRRVIRAAAETLGLSLNFDQGEEILEICLGKVKSSELSCGWKVTRRGEEVRFERSGALGDVDYEYRLPVPGNILVSEAGLRFEAEVISLASEDAKGTGSLLDAKDLASELVVRNWRPGDRFWPLHAKTPKKIKELLQEKHVTGRERQLWPVVVSGPEVVWLRGFAVAKQFSAKAGARLGILIRETTL